MRRTFPALLAAVALLTLAGCGDDAPESSSSSTTAPGGDWCEQLDDEPTEELVDAVPAEHRDAAAIVVAFSTAVDGQLEADESGAPADSAAVTDLAAEVVGESERLDAFASAVQSSCPGIGDEAVTGLRALTTTAAMASEDRDDAYCEALATSFESDSDGGVEAISALAAQAPGSHRVALEAIAALGSGQGSEPDEAASDEAIASFMGLGLYAEAVCGVQDAFAQMMLAGALLSMGGGSFGETNAGTIGTEPPTADPADANAALPAGTDLSFSAQVVDLDDDGERKASVVMPTGWDVDDEFGVTIEPPEGSPYGFFTSMSVAAGCDGMCEVTDWEARLRGPDGYLTNWAGDRNVTEERDPAGGDGTVITTSDDGDARAVVVRWDDSVDQYFRCEVTLDADDAALLGAFVAACEDPRPNWFAVG